MLEDSIIILTTLFTIQWFCKKKKLVTPLEVLGILGHNLHKSGQGLNTQKRSETAIYQVFPYQNADGHLLDKTPSAYTFFML